MSDFNLSNVQDMTDPTRAMWSTEFGWDELAEFIDDPILFLNKLRSGYDEKKMRFPDDDEYLVLNMQNDRNLNAEVVAAGMDDTNVVDVFFNRCSADEQVCRSINLVSDMPLVIDLRQNNGIAMCHFHLAPDDRSNLIYLMIRYPRTILKALQTKIANHDYLTYVNSDARQPKDLPIVIEKINLDKVIAEWSKLKKYEVTCSRLRGECPTNHQPISMELGALELAKYVPGRLPGMPGGSKSDNGMNDPMP